MSDDGQYQTISHGLSVYKFRLRSNVGKMLKVVFMAIFVFKGAMSASGQYQTFISLFMDIYQQAMIMEIIGNNQLRRLAEK